MKQDVVITGLGAVSAYGLDTTAFWEGICSGNSAIKPLQPLEGIKMTKAAKLPDYAEDELFTTTELSLLDRFSQLAIIAAQQAVLDSNLDFDDLKNTATIIGSGGGGKHTDEEGYHKLYKEGKSRVHPLMIPKGMHSAVASSVSRYLGSKGPAFSVASACSSGAHAVIQAAMMIQLGIVDVAIVGGSDAPFPYGLVKAWDAMRVVTNDACRPFSKDRSGMILGEGAGILVLESKHHAQHRGARIYAEIIGYGMSSDAGHITRPDLAGMSQALESAIKNAAIQPENVDYINAHGTGTVANDRIETMAIKRIFGDHAKHLAVSSSKPLHGHALGASSALEIISTAMTLYTNIIPPTINHTTDDEECDLDYVLDKKRCCNNINIAMSNSFAFGGLNAVIVLKKTR